MEIELVGGEVGKEGSERDGSRGDGLRRDGGLGGEELMGRDGDGRAVRRLVAPVTPPHLTSHHGGLRHHGFAAIDLHINAIDHMERGIEPGAPHGASGGASGGMEAGLEQGVDLNVVKVPIASNRLPSNPSYPYNPSNPCDPGELAFENRCHPEIFESGGNGGQRVMGLKGMGRREMGRRKASKQIYLLACANFATMGMWNSLNGIGALGTGDTKMAAYCNVAAYLAGIIGGVVAGGAVNVIGVQKAAFVGVLMQTTGIISYWLYYYRKLISLATVTIYAFIWGLFVPWFTCATGTALVHYPVEKERNRFISIVSIFLNIGGLIGGTISLILNFAATGSNGDRLNPDGGSIGGSIGGSTIDGSPIEGSSSGRRALSEPSYLAIIVISSLGMIFASLLVEYDQVVRSDKTTPAIEKKRIVGELKNLMAGIFDLTLWCLVPVFLCVLWHEVVLFNFLNSGVSNVRTRAFNSGIYYVGRIVASPIFHKVVDLGGDNLRVKMVLANVIIVSFLVVGIFGIAPVFLGVHNLQDSKGIVDFTEPRAAFLVAAFLAYGGLETLCANYVFWLIGVLPVGDANAKNRYIGWSRSVTNLGGMLAWLIDSFDSIRPPMYQQWMINLVMWSLALTGALTAYVRTTGTGKNPLPTAPLGTAPLPTNPLGTNPLGTSPVVKTLKAGRLPDMRTITQGNRAANKLQNITAATRLHPGLSPGLSPGLGTDLSGAKGAGAPIAQPPSRPSSAIVSTGLNLNELSSP